MTGKKLYAALFGAFVLGVIMTPKNKVVEVEKIVPQEVPAPLQEEWKDLKATDDQIIALAGSGFEHCSDMITAVSNEDEAELEKILGRVTDLTAEIETLHQARSSLLIKLGY